MKKLHNLWWLLLLIGLHIGFLTQIKFTAWPEMLAYPWLMSQGFSPYGDIIHPYPPALLYLLLWWFSVTGFSISSLQTLTYLVAGISNLLIFMIAQKVFGLRPALISVASFTILSVIFGVNGLWFDSASIPLLLLAYYFLQSKRSLKRKEIFAGICLSLAVLIKQTNFIFAVLIAATLIKNKGLFWQFVIAFFLPMALTLLYFVATPNFFDFWYWTVIHSLFIHARMPGFVLWPSFKQLVTLVIIFTPLLLIRRTQKQLFFWTSLTLMFALPRFDYFHLLPASAFLSIGLASLPLRQRQFQWLGLTYFLIVSTMFIMIIGRDWGSSVRFFEPEVLKTRTQLVEAVPTDKPIFFYNVPAQYFVMTPLIPVKPWADTFPWYLEVTGVQEKIVTNLDRVDYIVFQSFGSGDQYELGVYKPQLIDAYVKNYFVPIATLESNIVILKRY